MEGGKPAQGPRLAVRPPAQSSPMASASPAVGSAPPTSPAQWPHVPFRTWGRGEHKASGCPSARRQGPAGVFDTGLNGTKRQDPEDDEMLRATEKRVILTRPVPTDRPAEAQRASEGPFRDHASGAQVRAVSRGDPPGVPSCPPKSTAVYGQNDLKLVKSISDLDLVGKVESSTENQSCHQNTVNGNTGPDPALGGHRMPGSGSALGQEGPCIYQQMP